MASKTQSTADWMRSLTSAGRVLKSDSVTEAFFLLTAITQLLQIGSDGLMKFGRFSLLFSQLRYKSLHLLIERLSVVLLHFSPDPAARRQLMAMSTYFFKFNRLTETGHIIVLPGLLSPAAVNAVNHPTSAQKDE
jgi:hypothetical protein